MNEFSNTAQWLLTAPQAAKLLHISDRSLWQLAKDGKIPAVKIGRSVRFDPNDLRAWVERHKSATVSGAADTISEILR